MDHRRGPALGPLCRRGRGSGLESTARCRVQLVVHRPHPAWLVRSCLPDAGLRKPAGVQFTRSRRPGPRRGQAACPAIARALFEAGVTRALLGTLRLDANVYRRIFTNYADDELLLNTGIGFPVSFRGATIDGFEARASVPHWRSLSGSFSYSLLRGTARRPITGGLFLPAAATTA